MNVGAAFDAPPAVPTAASAARATNGRTSRVTMPLIDDSFPARPPWRVRRKYAPYKLAELGTRVTRFGTVDDRGAVRAPKARRAGESTAQRDRKRHARGAARRDRGPVPAGAPPASSSRRPRSLRSG